MAAATENSTRVLTYWGNQPVEITDITFSDTNTFESEFASVLAAWFEPTTAAAHGMTISGKTITLASGGALTGKLFVIGDTT